MSDEFLLYRTDDQLHAEAVHYAQAPDGLQTVTDQERKLVVQGSRAAEAFKSSKDAHQSLNDGSADLEQKGKAAGISYKVKIREAFGEAPLNPVFNHDEAMDALNRLQSRVHYFQNAVAHARAYLVPLSFLDKLKASAQMFRVNSALASQRALVSAVQRVIASKALLLAEGTVELPANSGRTGLLIAESKEAFRLAKLAVDDVDREIARQRSLGIGVAFDDGGAK